MILDLNSYDWIVLNSSAGKDSQTMIRYVVNLAKERAVPMTRLVVVHADLGRMEWPGTKELAQEQAEHYGLRFMAIARPQGDLLSHIKQRGMWPSSTTRYCTSDHKRGQVAKIITRLTDEKYRRYGRKIRILNCMGLRAEESPARAKKVPFRRLDRVTNGKRIVDEWLPILHWKLQQVWDSIRESGVRYHSAYDLGMPRLSCIFCIFAPKPALVLACKYNKPLLDEYVEVERKIGHQFRLDVSLEEVKKLVEADAPVGKITGAWNM